MPTFATVQQEELRDRGKSTISPFADRKELPKEAMTTGLAFSGGGIRSATFNLGILQGLAERRLLGAVDYMATVSGGGYIGAWLASWIKRGGGVEAVEKELGSFVPRLEESVLVAEPKPVNFLREYSNYLTPRKGIFGADTWAAIATYLRNVLLNQTVLILLLGAAICVPWQLGLIVRWGSHGSLIWLALAIAIIAVLTVWQASGLAQATSLIGVKQSKTAEQKYVLLLLALPLFVSTVLLTMAFWQNPLLFNFKQWLFGGALIYAAGHAAGLLARQRTLRSASEAKNQCVGAGHEKEMASQKLGFQRILWIPLTGLMAGALGGVLLWLLSRLFEYWKTGVIDGSGAWHAASWGPPLLVVSMLLTGTLHIGLLKFLIPSQEHEWWARFGGLLLMIALAWAALFGLTVFVPLAAAVYSGWVKTKLSLLAGWAISTGAGVLFGKSRSTSGTAGDRSAKSAIALMAPYVFIAGLVALLSMGAHTFVVKVSRSAGAQAIEKGEMAPSTAGAPAAGTEGAAARPAESRGNSAKAPATNPAAADEYWQTARRLKWRRVGLGMITLFVLSVLLAWRVDINNFSMNTLYRNRLVRCYLGASRKDRECSANPFTGFDPGDDSFLADFVKEKGYDGPYPLICAALNVTHGDRLAWQERKAESFVFGPRFCGYEYPDMHAKNNEAGKDPQLAVQDKQAYQKTEQYGYPATRFNPAHENRGGVRLGTAISISGAAASPNMGYHTSPPLAFLMTLFNVRLGWWLANPRYETEEYWIKPQGGPPCSLIYLLSELFASTTDRSKYVYLSDGGHFENLGIYELVRRRCKWIVASDADADTGVTFGDLGNAIRKCRSDFGVEIEIDPSAVVARDGFSEAHAVVGTIKYPQVCVDGKTYLPEMAGSLLYIKPAISRDLPPDILSYRSENLSFPFETTADQWFSESQFESYRKLGRATMRTILQIEPAAGAPIDGAIEGFFREIEESSRA